MKKESISKELRDKAALVFLRHPGEAFSRADIQNMLDTSKSTAFRILQDLSERLKLSEVTEGQRVYYTLSEESAKDMYKAIDFVLQVSDRERLALSYLLNMGFSSNLFGETVGSLGRKLEKAGLFVSNPESVREVWRAGQNVSFLEGQRIDTLISALETKTKVELAYKGAYSDKVRVHELWPVGLYMRDGNLYLYAYSPKYGDATSFAYSRMKGISLKYDEHYDLPDGISLDDVVFDPFGISMAKPRRAKVRILGRQAFYEKEKRWPEDTVITDAPDGSIEIELTISDPFAFHTWALSLGKSCVVESPEDIAEWVYQEHKDAMTLYNGRFQGSDGFGKE